jgi:hypothetical protein
MHASLFVLIAGYRWKEQHQKTDKSAMEDLHQTSVTRLVVPFHVCIVKEGFKFWVVG